MKYDNYYPYLLSTLLEPSYLGMILSSCIAKLVSCDFHNLLEYSKYALHILTDNFWNLVVVAVEVVLEVEVEVAVVVEAHRTMVNPSMGWTLTVINLSILFQFLSCMKEITNMICFLLLDFNLYIVKIKGVTQDMNLR